jgi:hypothetical protein
MNPRSIGNIVINGHRERIRFLENHADALPELDDIVVFKDFLAVELDASRYSYVFNQVVHSVEGF